ncbi:MAG: LysR family transcriptional regulator [Acidimicrobiia bacterium]|nr:LysR family transcriptional regulator [Acidimicrobiia bacterium]
MSGISLQQLRYVFAIGGGSTFSEIATDVDVTQSAISQGISRLEQLLGAKLVEPFGRRRRLTAAGERFALYAGRVLEESEKMLEAIGEHREGRSGRLRVGMVDAAALYLFDRSIAKFHAGNPNVEMSVVVDSSAALLERLARFRDEIAVVVSPAPGFDTIDLRSETLHLYGPGTGVEPASWVLYPSGSHTRELIDDGLRTAGFRPRSIIESDNPAIQRQLALLTGSWTVLPPEVAEAGDEPLALVREGVTRRTFVIALRTGSEPSRLTAAFIDTITKA